MTNNNGFKGQAIIAMISTATRRLTEPSTRGSPLCGEHWSVDQQGFLL